MLVVSKFRDKQKDEFINPLAISRIWESVGWSGFTSYGDRLIKSIKQSSFVYGVTDDGVLVGLLTGMEDGLHANITFLVVDKHYQGKGAGKLLLGKFCVDYKNYICTVLTHDCPDLYKRFGFREHMHGMSSTYLHSTARVQPLMYLNEDGTAKFYSIKDYEGYVREK